MAATTTAEAATNEGTDARLAAQLEAIITARLAADRLVLPALPAAALKCLKLLRDPELSLLIANDQERDLSATSARSGPPI